LILKIKLSQYIEVDNWWSQNFEEIRNYPKRRISLTAGFTKPLDELQLSKFINETVGLILDWPYSGIGGSASKEP
jgi:hypothetical protein